MKAKPTVNRMISTDLHKFQNSSNICIKTQQQQKVSDIFQKSQILRVKKNLTKYNIFLFAKVKKSYPLSVVM